MKSLIYCILSNIVEIIAEIFEFRAIVFFVFLCIPKFQFKVMLQFLHFRIYYLVDFWPYTLTFKKITVKAEVGCLISQFTN